MAVHHIPTGHNAVSPYLVTKSAEQVIGLMRQAFGGEELHRSTRPDGTIMHAEVRIGDSVVMIGEACGEFPAMPCMVHVYVPDCDRAYARALQAGATSVREPALQPYGDRTGGVVDAGGNQWWLATHEEDVAHDEIERRMKVAGKGCDASGATGVPRTRRAAAAGAGRRRSRSGTRRGLLPTPRTDAMRPTRSPPREALQRRSRVARSSW